MGRSGNAMFAKASRPEVEELMTEVCHYALRCQLSAQTSKTSTGLVQNSRVASASFNPVAALLVPKRHVGLALSALNSMRPRWGALICAAVTSSRCRKGVHVPDPRDTSPEALRAVELPPPLDDLIHAAVRETHGADSIFGEGEDEIRGEGRGGPEAFTSVSGVPPSLLTLIAEGSATFISHFEPPCELDEMHPCPSPNMQWIAVGAESLPAQEALDTSGSIDQMACKCQLNPFRFIELFAGIGGFRLALETLGGSCVFASEIHPTARAVYTENWGMLGDDVDTFSGDIRLVPSEDIPEHDLLTAGFPCQPFSSLGCQRGLNDHRGQLFMHICRILRTRRPRAALLENVPGLLVTDGGRAMQAVSEELRASGYRIAHRIYNSQSLLPQKRKRVYIVAIRADLSEACESFRFPWLPELDRVLEEILERHLSTDESLQLSEEQWLKLRQSQAFKESPEDVLRPLKMPAAPLVSSYGMGAGRFVKYTQLVPPVAGDEILTPRRLSCRECARLQGFPESFTYHVCDGPPSWYRAIGNAVSPPIVCAVAGALLCAVQHPRRGCRLPGTAAAVRLALRSGPQNEVTMAELLSRTVVQPGCNASVPLTTLLDVLDRR
eukprot:TRINITY_DN58243_c0_g1_i1.p1 TRINITY_DN58243_c0_g1~~TRINITY_DN58243_c0_g1_i1.p1  ORF type:complete len:610 (+),score=75.26 TRINITY_DN58243_c0_g1_i1:96-1925(+)